ncbi:Acylphosphatase-domain-containing protein [Chytriomyces cf. hyalinus JEL632]|nr:Acylphosphatase-domain-containing protein [Chytriomyces cf. hyalinus JEL632]
MRKSTTASSAADPTPEKALQDALKSHVTGKAVVVATPETNQKQATETTMKFRVYGKVQGVFFRKHTAAKAVKLGLVGYVRNNQDAERSVEGVVMGAREKVADFAQWVSCEGSPKSRISRCDKSFVGRIQAQSFEIL